MPFLTPLITKALMYLVGTALVIGLVLGAYHVWKKAVLAEAAQQQIVEQLTAALEQAAKVAEQNRKLQAVVDQLGRDLRAQKEALDKKLDEIERDIDGAEDRPASDVLKDTVKKLGGK
jgi:uncharacterized protein HemX